MEKREIAEAFSKHDFESTFPFLADRIHWDIVGAQIYYGKESVVETCRHSLAYIKTVKCSFLKFQVLEGQDHVTVESISEFEDTERKISKVASCDIFLFEENKVIEIISYNLELKNSNLTIE